MGNTTVVKEACVVSSDIVMRVISRLNQWSGGWWAGSWFLFLIYERKTRTTILTGH